MRARRRYRGLVIGALVMLLGGAGQAQELPRPAVEAGTGWAGFVDESLIDHSTFGGAARRSTRTTTSHSSAAAEFACRLPNASTSRRTSG